MSLWIVSIIVFITAVISDKTAYKRGYRDGRNSRDC